MASLLVARSLTGEYRVKLRRVVSDLGTPHSVVLLWTSDRRVSWTFTSNTQHSQDTDYHVPGGIRTHNLSKRVIAYLRLDHAATGVGFFGIY